MRDQQKCYDASPLLRSLQSGQTLTAIDAKDLFEAMMSGSVDEIQIAGVLSLMSTRVPTVDELTAAATVMRNLVTRIPTHLSGSNMLDTAGTGGAPKTFNVSTAAAIVAAACDIPVAKHGNRSRTGRGSAEVLSGLGVNVDAPPEVQARCLDETGVCFCFAIHHHPATRFVVPIRQSLTFPTIFNLLGPLTNPAGASKQLLGVWDTRYAQLMAHTLLELGSDHAMVVHSEDGLDEISISAPTRVWHLQNGTINEEIINPEDLGFTQHPIASVTANDLQHATDLILNILNGTDRGPRRDMVLLNAAAAILIGGKDESMRGAVEKAKQAIESGAAIERLEQLCRVSNAVGT